MRLGDYEISHGGLKLRAITNYNSRATNIQSISQSNDTKDALVICEYNIHPSSTKPASINSNDEYTGIILYAYDGKMRWNVNNILCERGTIIIKKTSEINNIKSRYGKVHGKLYKSVFGVDPDRSRVVGSGFAYYKNQWKFNSFTFNAANTQFHTDEKEMNALEQKWVRRTILNWIEKGQTITPIQESIGILNASIKNEPLKYISYPDKHIIRNPLVLIAGASKYNSPANDLPGAEKDMETLINLLGYKYHYEIKSTFDIMNKSRTNRLSLSQLNAFIDNQYDCLNQNRERYDSLIFILAGHGNGDKDGNDTFITSDLKEIAISDIKSIFTSTADIDYQKYFADKPKIFMKLACRGNVDGSGISRGTVTTTKNKQNLRNPDAIKAPTYTTIEGEMLTIWSNTSSKAIQDKMFQGRGGFLSEFLKRN